jgi:hypothetical protein
LWRPGRSRRLGGWNAPYLHSGSSRLGRDCGLQRAWRGKCSLSDKIQNILRANWLLLAVQWISPFQLHVRDKRVSKALALPPLAAKHEVLPLSLTSRAPLVCNNCSLIRRGNHLPGVGASYGLNRRFVLGGENFRPYESEYFAREKHKVRGLADREFFAVHDQP